MGRIVSNWSVGKIILIILSFRVGTSTNKKNIKVRYESSHSLLLCDSTASSALNFCFYLFYCNLKEKDHIRRKINIKKIICEIGILINVICRKLGSVGPVQQKIKLPSLYDDLNNMKVFMTETWSLV